MSLPVPQPVWTSFKHPDNKGRMPVDWRLPENRKTMFLRWLHWRLAGWNIDHFAWNLAYMETEHSVTKAPMTKKQRLWFSYLFGMTYQSSLAWIFYQHFPDYDKFDLDEVDRWNRATMPLQRFPTDTRYNKGHLVKMWGSFRDWVEREGKGDIEEAFDKFLVEDQVKSFHQITEQIRGWMKFGRMTSWLCAQTLYEGCGLPIRPDTMYTDDPSNVSVWNGMCYFRGEEHKTVGDPPKFAGYSPTPQDRERFRAYEKELMAQAEDFIPAEHRRFLSYFTLETHLCQFKKLNVGFDYPGQNVGDAVIKYLNAKAKWPGVNFRAFEDAVNGPRMFKHIRWHCESKALMQLFAITGQPVNMNNLYPDLPDMFLELDLDPNVLLQEDCDLRVEPKINALSDRSTDQEEFQEFLDLFPVEGQRDVNTGVKPLPEEPT